jgi:hypothetical protein
MMRPYMCLMLAIACGGKGEGADADDGGGPGPTGPPDVTGKYNVQIEAATGCSGDSHWLEEWVPGPMTIEGEGERLTFDFGFDLVFSGIITEIYEYNFDGIVEEVTLGVDTGQVSAKLDVFNSGGFEQGSNGCWLMDGDFVVTVDDDGIEITNCEISGGAKGYQLRGVECDGLGS